MRRLRAATRVLTTSDAAFSMGERIVGWIISGGIGILLASVGGAVIGWLAGNLLYGLLIGMGLGMLILMGFAVKAARVAAEPAAAQVGVSDMGTNTETELHDDDISLPYPRPRPLTSGELSAAHLSDLSFRAADLITPEQAMNQTSVRDKTFYKCTIHGPAMLFPSSARFAGESEFFNEPRTEHPDSMLYPLDPTQARSWWAGVIGIRGCVFRDCTFVDVGFMQEPSAIQKHKDHIEGKGDIHI